MGKGGGCAFSKPTAVKYEVRPAESLSEPLLVQRQHLENPVQVSAPSQPVQAYGHLPPGYPTTDPRLVPLPLNWEQKIDPTTGRLYYVNHTANYVTWEDPRLLQAAATAQAGGGVALGVPYPAAVVQPSYRYGVPPTAGMVGHENYYRAGKKQRKKRNKAKHRSAWGTKLHSRSSSSSSSSDEGRGDGGVVGVYSGGLGGDGGGVVANSDGSESENERGSSSGGDDFEAHATAAGIAAQLTRDGDGDGDRDVVEMYGGAGPRDLPGGGPGSGWGGSWGRLLAGRRSQPRRKSTSASWKRGVQMMVVGVERRVKGVCVDGVVLAMCLMLSAIMPLWPLVGARIATRASHWLARNGWSAAARGRVKRVVGASIKSKKFGPASYVSALLHLLFGLYLASEYVTLRLLSLAHHLSSYLSWRLLVWYYEYVHLHPAAELRVLPQQFCSTIAPRAREVTIVTQASLDRLAAVEAMASAWDGGMTVALFVPDAANGNGRVVDSYVEGIAAMHARIDARGRCRLHIILATTPSVSPSMALYPVNALRNLALEHTETELVLLLDADFVPSRGLHSALVDDPAVYEQIKWRALVERHLFVLPAFELLEEGKGEMRRVRLQASGGKTGDSAGKGGVECCEGGGGGEEEGAVPGCMHELGEAWRAGLAVPFHCHHFPQGHMPTDYTRFFHLSSHTHTPYPVPYRHHYEPYIIAAKTALPRYDPRFRGYGLNKISHVYECAMRGMSFYVMPRHFVTALPHPHSLAWHHTYGPNKDPMQQLRIRGLFRQFKDELHTKLGHLPPTQPCTSTSTELCNLSYANVKDLEAGGDDAGSLVPETSESMISYGLSILLT